MKNAIGELHEAAIKAYSAHIRSYPAKEKAVRHIFSPRALHLGHVARSFALKEQPKALSGKRRAAEGSDDEDEEILKSTGRKRNARLAFGGKGKQSDDGNGKEAADKAAGGGNKKAKKKKSLVESSDIAALEDIMKGTKRRRANPVTRRTTSVLVMAINNRPELIKRRCLPWRKECREVVCQNSFSSGGTFVM